MPCASRLTYAQGVSWSGSADALYRAQRFGHIDRLFGRRDSHTVGAPAGDVRVAPDAERPAAGRLPLLLKLLSPARRPCKSRAIS